MTNDSSSKFSAADMATASAQGFRAGVAHAQSANVPEAVADVLAEIRAFPEAAGTRALQTWADRIERALSAQKSGAFTPTAAMFNTWCDTHDMQPADRDAFNDAATLYLLYTTPQPVVTPTGCDLAAEAIAYHNAVGALECLSAAFSAMDQNDTELEKWPQRAIDALACAGWAVVPCALPYEVLGEAWKIGAFETGNPKHGWDFLVSKTRIGPHGEPNLTAPQPVTVTDEMVEKAARGICLAKGWNPDEQVEHTGQPKKKCFNPDGTPFLQWQFQTLEARAALAAALAPQEQS